MASQLVRGANAPMRGTDQHPLQRVLVELAWPTRTHTVITLFVVGCDALGRAVSPAHHVAYRSPSTDGSGCRFEVLVDLTAVPPDIPHLVFALANDDRAFYDLAGLTATVRSDSGELIARYEVGELSAWSALVVAELYRRNDQWKVRAIGQGLADGQAGLRRSFALTG